jgi:hypothetical protein
MSFEAKITIDGKTTPINSFSVSASQSTDGAGFPTSDVFTGQFSVGLEFDEAWVDAWAIVTDPHKFFDGKIEFNKIGAKGSALKTFEFKDTYLVGYGESFSPGSAMYLNLNFSARSLQYGSGAAVENIWPNFKK